MGDAYQGFRYVATTAAYFAAVPWRRKSFVVAAGRLFRDDRPGQPGYEALLGAETARGRACAWAIDSTRARRWRSIPLTVVGILRPTRSADDRAIFISLASYWGMNEIARKMQIKPLTAVLVRPKRMSDLPALHRELNVVAGDAGGLPQRECSSASSTCSGSAEEVLAYPGHRGDRGRALPVRVDVQRDPRAPARDRHHARPRRPPRDRSRHRAAGVLRHRARRGRAGVLGGHGIAYLGAQLLAARAGVVADPFAVGALQPMVVGGVVRWARSPGCCPPCSPIGWRSRRILRRSPERRPRRRASPLVLRAAPGTRSGGGGLAGARERSPEADVRPAGGFDAGELRRHPADQELRRQGRRDPGLHHSRRPARSLVLPAESRLGRWATTAAKSPPGRTRRCTYSPRRA